jgi:hypothetical protein
MSALFGMPQAKIWNRGHLRTFARILVFIAAVGITPSHAQDQDNDHSHPRVDLSQLVVVGDSLSAGFQNDSLLDTQQPHGYASLVAAQAHVSLLLPLTTPPGVPNVLELVSPGPPPILTRAPGTSPGRDNPTVQATDLAVPGASLHDVLNSVPTFPVTPSNVLTDLILGEPGIALGDIRSQVQWAEALHPTTIFLWAGNEDALGAAIAANPALLTPVADFRSDYAELMGRLSATGATLIIANIPDVTIVPYLTPAEDIAEELGLPLFVIEPILGINAGDFVTPDAIPLILARLADPLLGPLPPDWLAAEKELTKPSEREDANTSSPNVASSLREHASVLN